MEKLATITLAGKTKLEDISLSIHSKRKTNLDTQIFLLTDLKLAEHDIRQNREIGKLKNDLIRDGQLQPLTITKNGTDYIIVNGRTRYLDMVEINKEEETLNMFEFVSVEVYENLTVMEQDYLNAQINVKQTPLTSNEKLAFVDRYEQALNAVELGEALNLSPSQVLKYKATAKLSVEAREKFVQQAEGYGRGEINIETAGDCVISYQTESGGVEPDEETVICLGDTFGKMKMNRDVKRKLVKKVSKQTAKLQKDKRIASSYTVQEIVKIAEKEATFNNNEGGSGDVLPKNSSKKYEIIDGLLKKDTYEFAILLFAESLYRIDDKGKEIESETKRIVDNVQNIMVVGNELIKLKDIEEYGKNNKRKVIIKHGDVMAVCQKLRPSTRKGIVYVNGASLYSQRPEFVNFLKKIYPNSTIVVVVLDLLFGKSQVTQDKRDKEIITVYGGIKNFNEFIEFYKKRVKNLKTKKYATTPQQKYIFIS